MTIIYKDIETAQEEGIKKTMLTAEEVETKYKPFWSDSITIIDHKMRLDMDDYNKHLPLTMGANVLNPMRAIFNTLSALQYEAKKLLLIKIHYVDFDKNLHERRVIPIEGEDFEKVVSITSDLIRLMECGEQISTAALELFLESDCFVKDNIHKDFTDTITMYRDMFKEVTEIAYKFSECFDTDDE